MVAENKENRTLEAGLHGGDRPATKYLDEYGPYTHDGYMAPKHVYAEPEEVMKQPVPPQRMTGIYNEPGPVYSIPKSRENSALYEDVQESTRMPELTENPLYETPQNNKQIEPDRRALAASEYDVPRNLLCKSESESESEA